MHKRGISYDLIHQCTDSELVYQNYRNGYYNIVFVGYDADKVPRYATVRGIDSDFRGDVSGSNKNYSFAISHKSQYLHLFESAIDLLSFATLEKDTSRAHDNLLSLSGVYKPKKKIEDSTLPLALTQFLTDHPHYLSFAAYVKSDRVFLNRLYPEQSPACRFPITRGGKLYAYCINHGLVVYPDSL